MKIALTVLALFVLTVVLIVAIGALLPVKHRASRAARFNATPQQLWALITGPQDWRRDITHSQSGTNADGTKWMRETGRDGRVINYVVGEEDPPRRLVRRIADKNLPFGGAWTYQLTPAGDATELRITEDGEVYNPVFRFVSRFVLGHTHTIDQYLNAAAAATHSSIQISD